MNRYSAPGAARSAVGAAPSRPAVSILHDREEGRVVVFRIEPGQQVARHSSPSAVFLSVVSGTGFVSGADGEEAVGPGDIIAFSAREPHGMRADRQELVVAALITPQPGKR